MNAIEHSEHRDVWRLVAAGTTTPIEDNTPKIINVCNCPELGYWCADYITEEMKKNLYTPQGQKLKELLSATTDPVDAIKNYPWWKKIACAALPSVLLANMTGESLSNMALKEKEALLYWKNLVGYNCIWDHKPFFEKKFKCYVN